MLHPSKQALDQLMLIRKDFIWRAHRPKIKHSTLIGDYIKGGHKDVDIESKFESLKIIWIGRLLDSNFHSWNVMPQRSLSEKGIQSIFHSNFKLSVIWQRKIASYPNFIKVLFPFGRMLALKNLQTLERLLVRQYGITVTLQNKETLYFIHNCAIKVFNMLEIF